MRFYDIPGLKSTKEKLMHAIRTGNIAHAQMFAGPEGSAVLPMAIAYATTLNCQNRQNGDACGECPSCVKSMKLIHPDMHYIFPVSAAKSKTGKDVVSDSFIEDWRIFAQTNPYGTPNEWAVQFGGEDKQLNISREESRNIIRKLALKPFEGGYKVVITWMAEYIHTSAANALLKLLEEPPDKTVFILATNDHEKIISTILSRVQLMKIRPFQRDEIASHLVTAHSVEYERAQQIASMSSGNMNEAIKLITEVDDDVPAMFREWMRICFKNNYPLMVDWAEKLGKASRLSQKGLFQHAMTVLRESLLVQNGVPQNEWAVQEEQKFVTNFSRTLDLNKLEQLYKIINTAYYHLERYGNPKIIFLDTSLQIAEAFKS